MKFSEVKLEIVFFILYVDLIDCLCFSFKESNKILPAALLLLLRLRGAFVLSQESKYLHTKFL